MIKAKGKSSKLWGGRFSSTTDQDVEAFTSSIDIDQRLWKVDIQGSIAHARMLGNTGIIPLGESQQLILNLQMIEKEIAESLELGENPFDETQEDIHSEIEARLNAKLGPLSGKLHTARSRNDQVATDLRLYLRDENQELIAALQLLQGWIISTSLQHMETLMPGATHFQPAQPVSLAHHLMAYFWMFQRDVERLQDLKSRINQLPLGSAALAGTSFPIDREMVREELKMDSICENSLDAVSDRDFVVEFLSAANLIMSHLSRWSEELILWSTPFYGFLELSDSVTTGSSIMPQKKNPDVAELTRGKSGRLLGALTGILSLLKGLPLSYNRDLQEDKFHLFVGIDTVKASVRLMRRQLESADFRTARMRSALKGDFSNATDLADELVRKGVPFRETHEVVGKIVRHCIANHLVLEDLNLAQLQEHHPLFDQNSVKVMQHEAVMRARNSRGGTGPDAVKVQITKAQKVLAFGNGSGGRIQNL